MSWNNLSFIKTFKVLDEVAYTIILFPPAPGYKIFYITLAVICAITTLTTIYLNACAVVTIWTTTALREKIPNFTIMMQSAVDLLNGLFVMPFFSYSIISEISALSSCLQMYVCKKMAVLVFFFSITTFSAMSYERYMGICHPFLHRTQVTKKKLFKYVIVAFTWQILAVGLTVSFPGVMRPLLAFVCLVFFVHTAFVYINIARAIRVKVSPNSNVQNIEERSKLKQYLLGIKGAKTCFLIIICCIGCYLPSVLLLSGMISPKTIFVKVILIRSFGVLTMLNSTLNSVILFWRDKKLRINAKSLPKCNTRLM